MAKLGNSYQGSMENKARAIAGEIRVSPKRANEVARAIRGMELAKARAYLERARKMEVAIPFTRFNRGVAHRAGIGPGAYTTSTCEAMIRLLDEVEANAGNRGLTGNLVIEHAATQKARVIMGRFKGGAHNTPTTHIEIVVKEKPEEKKKEVKKEEQKKEAEQSKPEKKKEVSEPAKEEKEDKRKAGSD